MSERPSEPVGDGLSQGLLFRIDPSWAKHWKGMPAYDHRDLEAARTIAVHFRNAADVRRFAELLGQAIGPRQRSLWYPEWVLTDEDRMSGKRYVSGVAPVPRYPVYIVSKGRWESRLTAKALDALGVPYRIVVEPQERDRYAAVIDGAQRSLFGG